MEQLVGFSVRNAPFMIIIFVMALLLGANALFNMPRGEDPPFNAPIFIVLAVYPGTSPSDMESLVADPIEDAMYELGDIKKIVTTCDDGLMVMQVEFTYDVNIETKNNDVVREVNRIRPDLPDGIVVLDTRRAASSDVAILQAALVAPTASFEDMKTQADILKDELTKIKDLKKVEIQAAPEQIVSIKIDLQRMAQNRLGLNQVLGLLQAANINIPGGSVDIGSKEFNIKTTSDFESLDDIRQTVVATSTDGRVVHLQDIATVSIKDDDEIHRARFNGQRALWIIAKLKDRKNIIAASKQMDKSIEDFKKRLPAGMHLSIGFDQAKSVAHRLGGLGKDFSIALFLVLLTLVPLGWRASIVVMISIPLSLAMGVAALDALGYTLNQLSIVGMVVALGLLVDDSIVVVENIERFLRMGYNRKEAAVAATKQIGVAVIGCTATLLLAFLPLTFLPEGSGDFIRSLPMAVLMTVLASLFVSLTIIPFLSNILLKPHEANEGNFFFRAFKKYINDPYHHVLVWAFKHPIMAILGTALIFVSSILLVPKIGFSLFPVSEKPMFMVNIESPNGNNINATDSITQQVEKYLFTQKNVVNVHTNIGKGNPRVYYNEFQVENAPNYAQLLVLLKSDLLQPEILETIDSLRVAFAKIPGAEIKVKQFQQGPPVEAPIDIRIIGENLDSLRDIALRVEDIFNETKGTLYVKNSLKTQKTELKVNINKEKAGLMGISAAEVAKTIRLGVAGLDIGSFRNEDGDEFTLKVTVPEEKDNALAQFSKIYITTYSGALVPINQIADIQLSAAAPLIRHFNKKRFTTVSCFVEQGFNTNKMTDEILKKLENFQLPRGYYFVAAGERESSAESFGGMGTIVIIALFGLLAILVLEFRTFKSTLIVLSVVPLGIIGALYTLFIIGETLSFVATIGMIALVGIEIKNSILLVDYTNKLREEGMPLEESILNGAETRFLPILLTTLTAIGGLIPLVLENSPLISPLAWVLIGGLISSTLLSRIITPLLYKLLPPKVTIKS